MVGDPILYTSRVEGTVSFALPHKSTVTRWAIKVILSLSLSPPLSQNDRGSKEEREEVQHQHQQQQEQQKKRRRRPKFVYHRVPADYLAGRGGGVAPRPPPPPPSSGARTLRRMKMRRLSRHVAAVSLPAAAETGGRH